MRICRVVLPKRLSKRSVALALIALIGAVKILFSPQENLIQQQERHVITGVNSSVGPKKVILLWHPRFWSTKNIDPDACGRCEFTTNKDAINSSETAAVIFRSELIIPEEMPPRSIRRKDQLYIWSAGESASTLFHARKIRLFWESKYSFNMTMSFRRDSSLYHPYGTADESLASVRRKGYADDLKKLIAVKSKTNLAVAVVSNCNSTWGARVRLTLLNNLIQAGLKADYFGGCFTGGSFPKSNTNQLEKTLSKYKFYLAFENSYHCRDYITEKFYRNALNIGVVPVVWGTAKEDYKAVAPPGSFIHVEDFPSLTHLIEYLNYLDKNDTAYIQYFRWYSTNSFTEKKYDKDYTYCVLCKIIHGKDPQQSLKVADSVENSGKYFFLNTSQRTIPFLYSWYYYGNSRDCLRTKLRIGANNTKI